MSELDMDPPAVTRRLSFGEGAPKVVSNEIVAPTEAVEDTAEVEPAPLEAFDEDEAPEPTEAYFEDAVVMGEPVEVTEITLTAEEAAGINPTEEAEEAACDPEIVVDPTKLDQLSVEELQKVETEAHNKIVERQRAEKQAVIDQIVKVTKDFGVTVEELVDALGGLKVKRKGVKAKAKYHNPETGVSWSGRGKEPVWLRGKNREDYRIG